MDYGAQILGLMIFVLSCCKFHGSPQNGIAVPVELGLSASSLMEAAHILRYRVAPWLHGLASTKTVGKR